MGARQGIKDLTSNGIPDYFSGKELHLIDFKFMTPYIDLKTGKHLKNEKVSCIQNMKNDLISLNQLKSLRTSRRDDLEMLCSLMLYVYNYYTLPDLVYPRYSKLSQEQRMLFLLSYKQSYDLEKMCRYVRD